MFVVMSTHSPSTDRRGALLQVVSKAFRSREEADSWRDFCETEYLDEHPRGPHKFFVIETEFWGFKP